MHLWLARMRLGAVGLRARSIQDQLVSGASAYVEVMVFQMKGSTVLAGPGWLVGPAGRRKQSRSFTGASKGDAWLHGLKATDLGWYMSPQFSRQI